MPADPRSYCPNILFFNGIFFLEEAGLSVTAGVSSIRHGATLLGVCWKELLQAATQTNVETQGTREVFKHVQTCEPEVFKHV